MDELRIIAIGALLLVGTMIAWTDEGKPTRQRIFGWFTPKKPETPVEKAMRERKERFEQYAIEFLSYGFTENQAANKAEAKMQSEAKAAEEVKP